MNLNLVITLTLNKLIGLMCVFIYQKLQIGIDFFDMSTLHEYT